MNSVTQQTRYDHIRRDIGGPIGFVFDVFFCAFVIVAALGMIVIAYVILLVDYFTTPAKDLLNALSHHGPQHSGAAEKGKCATV